jgi:hypothetical protein
MHLPPPFRQRCKRSRPRFGAARVSARLLLGLGLTPPRFAKEARVLAEDIGDTVSKEMMLQIATGYDRLAKRAQERSIARGILAKH